MEENRQKSSAIHICLNFQPLRVFLSRCTGYICTVHRVFHLTNCHVTFQDVEEEAKMLEEDAEIVEKVCKEEIMATKAMDQSNMTPPKLFLGYFSMVRLQFLKEVNINSRSCVER